MIKDVRLQAGCGLKEAKEAVDAVYPDCSSYDEVIQKAVAHYHRPKGYFQSNEPQGYCIMGDNCHCGEYDHLRDVPEREGCFEWKSN